MDMPVVANSLHEALQSGFQVWDRDSQGYVVRRRPLDGPWEYGLVRVAGA